MDYNSIKVISVEIIINMQKVHDILTKKTDIYRKLGK